MGEDLELAALAELHAKNITNGLCPDCGGCGEIYDLVAIHRTGNPHAAKRCPRCKGNGKPRPGDGSPV